MRLTIRLVAVGITLLISTPKLPAPISEIPENTTPTPTPADSEAPTPKPSKKVKSKTATAERSAKRETAVVSSKVQPTPALPRFAGTWVGTLRQALFSPMKVTLELSDAGTSVKETSKLAASTHAAKCDGNTVSWRSGILNEIAWTLTPDSAGMTAQVTSKSMLGGDASSGFRRQLTQDVVPAKQVADIGSSLAAVQTTPSPTATAEPKPTPPKKYRWRPN